MTYEEYMAHTRNNALFYLRALISDAQDILDNVERGNKGMDKPRLTTIADEADRAVTVWYTATMMFKWTGKYNVI